MKKHETTKHKHDTKHPEEKAPVERSEIKTVTLQTPVVMPAIHAQKVPAPPANQSTGMCVECAEPVAYGQNQVCEKHMRKG